MKNKPEWRKALKIDWLINLLEESPNSDDMSKYMQVRNARITKDYFNNALVLYGLDRQQGIVDTYFHMDVTIDCLPKVFDSTFCFIKPDSGDFNITYFRLKKLSMKEVRQFRVLSPNVFEWSFGGILKDGSFIGSKKHYCLDGIGAYLYELHPENALTALTKDGKSKQLTKTSVLERAQFQLSMSVAFTQQYNWNIKFKNSKNRSIRLAAHPLEIAELFKLRDKFTDRRKALKHWVNNHWRTIQQSEQFDLKTFVRDHLRGQMEFSWFGLDCKIIIPPKEIEHLERITKEREQLKQTNPREDRRIVLN